jgi:hypothetical protein
VTTAVGEAGYCLRCQQWRRLIDPAALCGPGIVAGPLRLTFLPARCTFCLSSQRPWPAASGALPQEPGEIDRRLSAFDRRTYAYTSTSPNPAEPDDTTAFEHDTRYYVERLQEHGFRVGGSHERILHVARVYPEFFLSGYGKRLAYLIFFPMTLWFLRWRRRKNPEAHFWPFDPHRAGRAVVTDKRLVFYVDFTDLYYTYASFPHTAIQEVRQHRSAIRVQFKDAAKPTFTADIGHEAGLLLHAIYRSTDVRVRGGGADWRRADAGVDGGESPGPRSPSRSDSTSAARVDGDRHR